MSQFKKPSLSDKEWVRQCVQWSGYKGCEYSFCNIFVWNDTYNTQIMHFNDFFLSRSKSDEGLGYGMPAGKGSLREPIEEIIKDAQQIGSNYYIYGVTEENIPVIDSLFPGKFKFEEYRDGFDYIYLSDDLINLSGKKYHAKRNHISKFERTYNWEYENITPDNVNECLDMLEKWRELDRNRDNTDLNHETCALKIAINNFKELDLCGGMIKVDGEIIAFTMADLINNEVADIHFEKAFPDMPGGYTIINREFAARRLNNVKYLNREEDLGIEGLRKAKLSYYPAILLKKYRAVPV